MRQQILLQKANSGSNWLVTQSSKQYLVFIFDL